MNRKWTRLLGRLPLLAKIRLSEKILWMLWKHRRPVLRGMDRYQQVWRARILPLVIRRRWIALVTRKREVLPFS